MLWRRKLFTNEIPTTKLLNSVTTRLGNLLAFGQLFKALGNNLICPNLRHSYAIYVKVSKTLIFLVKSFLANFIDIWRLFTGHAAPQGRLL